MATLPKDRVKQIKLDGRSYTLRTKWYDETKRVLVPGIGIVGEYLPSGVTLDSPDLKEHLRARLEKYKIDHIRAQKEFQEKFLTPQKPG